MSKPSLKLNLKPLEFDATANKEKQRTDVADINPIPRPLSGGSSHRDLSTGKLHLFNNKVCHLINLNTFFSLIKQFLLGLQIHIE